MPASAIRMYGRLRPKRPNETRSTSGPSSGLAIQGSQAMLPISPSAAGPSPSPASRNMMATVKNPHGTPWAKYSPAKSRKRERVVPATVTV